MGAAPYICAGIKNLSDIADRLTVKQSCCTRKQVAAKGAGGSQNMGEIVPAQRSGSQAVFKTVCSSTGVHSCLQDYDSLCMQSYHKL